MKRPSPNTNRDLFSLPLRFFIPFLFSLLALLALFLFWGCGPNPLSPSADSTSAPTDEPAVHYPTGALPDDEDTLQSNRLPEMALTPLIQGAPAQLPAVVDLSSNMPPVGDQGSQGSCVGWASAYALKTSQEYRETRWSLTSPDHLFSPSWVYNQINGGQDGGAYPSDALRLLVQKGADTLAAFPYRESQFTRTPDGDSMARASKYRASRWSSLANDPNKLKKLVAAGRALLIAIDVYPQFMNLTSAKPVYNNKTGRLLGGHALCLMGYDDNLKAFKIINSWGPKWGKGGYGYIAYDFVKAQSPIRFAAYVLYDKANTP